MATRMSTRRKTTDVWAVIAGGGTAGHVHPALAIADELVRRGYEAQSVHFIGSERGLEKTVVPEHGYPLTLLPGRGIVRRLSVENLRSGLALGKALVMAVRALRRMRPNVLISVGGYASAPAAVAARLVGVPVVVMEQNAVPGAANRLASKWAKACAVSFDGTDLPNAVHTGNPARSDVATVNRARDRSASRAALGVSGNRRLVVVFGGSLGARSINKAVVGALPAIADRPDLSIRHIVGSRDWDDYGNNERLGSLEYVSIEYEQAMHHVYGAADLLVCRAGATSVAEIALTGTPAVLIPLPGAPGDHQTLNARALSDREGAVLVPDGEMTSERLVELIDELAGDVERLQAISTAARTQGRPDAASLIADLVMEHARVD